MLDKLVQHEQILHILSLKGVKIVRPASYSFRNCQMPGISLNNRAAFLTASMLSFHVKPVVKFHSQKLSKNAIFHHCERDFWKNHVDI